MNYYKCGNSLLKVKEPLEIIPEDYEEITEEEFKRLKHNNDTVIRR